jgi:integrase
MGARRRSDVTGAATIMLSQGVSLKTVQEILGHSTYYLTANVYGHVAPELSREAAQAMDKALAGIVAGKPGRKGKGR